MAVIAVSELFEDRGGASAIGQAQSVRTYTRSYLVKTSDKADDVVVVAYATNIPRVGDVYPSDWGAWCRTVTIAQLAGSQAWKVTCEYNSEFEISTNPLQDPAVITWTAEQFQRPTWKDRDGDAILNSAGQFFDTLPTVDDSRFVASIQKNVAVVPTWVAAWQDAVNSIPFTIDGITVAAELGKLNSLKIGNWQERSGIPYRSMSFDIHLRREGWDLEILDQGKKRKGVSVPTATQVGTWGENPSFLYPTVATGTGQDAGEPALLDGQGAQIKSPTPSTAVFLSFGYYQLPLT